MLVQFSKTFISTPAQRNVLNTHFQALSPAIISVQQRNMGAKHAPKFEKGKIKFKHYEKVKKLRDMSESARKEYQKMQEKTRQILWEPKTEVEALYKNNMLEIQLNPRKHVSEKLVFEMLQKSQSEQDFSLALRIWRVLLYRNIGTSLQTSQKIVDLFITIMNDYKTVVEILRNANTLKMTFSRSKVHEILGTLIERGEFDDAISIFKTILAHEQDFQPSKEDFFFIVSRLNKANEYKCAIDAFLLPITGGDPATYLSQHFVTTYEELLKACAATENYDVALKIRDNALKTGVAKSTDIPLFKNHESLFKQAEESAKQ